MCDKIFHEKIINDTLLSGGELAELTRNNLPIYEFSFNYRKNRAKVALKTRPKYKKLNHESQLKVY